MSNDLDAGVTLYSYLHCFLEKPGKPVPLGAEEGAARAKPLMCNPVSCPLLFGEIVESLIVYVCVSDYGGGCRHGWALGVNGTIIVLSYPGTRAKRIIIYLFVPPLGVGGGGAELCTKSSHKASSA